jgi:hypothetical protein
MTDQQQMDNFVGLSAVLTGFNKSIIAPTIDPINVKAEYFAKFTKEISNYQDILDKYAALKTITPALSDQQIGQQILANSAYETPCRQLIFLWYSGAWGSVVTTECTNKETGKTTVTKTVASNMLSAKSYTQGLAWQVMQSHPMGDSNYRYGYWAQQPADLDKYTGNSND